MSSLICWRRGYTTVSIRGTNLCLRLKGLKVCRTCDVICAARSTHLWHQVPRVCRVCVTSCVWCAAGMWHGFSSWWLLSRSHAQEEPATEDMPHLAWHLASSAPSTLSGPSPPPTGVAKTPWPHRAGPPGEHLFWFTCKVLIYPPAIVLFIPHFSMHFSVTFLTTRILFLKVDLLD